MESVQGYVPHPVSLSRQKPSVADESTALPDQENVGGHENTTLVEYVMMAHDPALPVKSWGHVAPEFEKIPTFPKQVETDVPPIPG
jgi:hypothetical protein